MPRDNHVGLFTWLSGFASQTCDLTLPGEHSTGGGRRADPRAFNGVFPTTHAWLSKLANQTYVNVKSRASYTKNRAGLINILAIPEQYAKKAFYVTRNPICCVVISKMLVYILKETFQLSNTIDTICEPSAISELLRKYWKNYMNILHK